MSIEENQAHTSSPASRTGWEVSDTQRDRVGAVKSEKGSSSATTLLEGCLDRFGTDQLATVVTFTRFIKPVLTITAPDGRTSEPQRAVLPRTAMDPVGAVSRLAGRPGATWLEAQGGLSPLPSWNHSNLNAPAVETVDVVSLADLFAERCVQLKGDTVYVELGDDDIRSLIAGLPRLVPATSSANGLPAKPTKPAGLSAALRRRKRNNVVDAGDRPAKTPMPEETALAIDRLVWLKPPPSVPNSMVIDDLPAFLSHPQLSDGSTITLTRAQVNALLNTGSTDLVIGGGKAKVPVIVREVADDIVSVATAAQPPTGSALTTNGEPNPGPTIEFALAMQWNQEWTLQGYRRGALLSTISLAPQEQTTIEIFSWDRRRSDSEVTSSVETNNNLDTTDTTRDTTDVFNECKKNTSMTRSAQGGLTLPIMSNIKLTLGGSIQDQRTTDSVARSTVNHVHENITKAVTTVRMARQTKITQTVEIGSERRVTRTITNPNMCRVLNLDYFEVVSRYKITTSFDRSATRLCLLIPSPLTPSFTRLTVRAHESTLRKALLERALETAFDAVRLLASRERACTVACERCICGGPSSVQDLPHLSPYTVQSLTDLATSWNALIKFGEVVFYDIKKGVPKGLTPQEIIRKARMWMYRTAVDALNPALSDIMWDLRTLMANRGVPTRENADDVWWAVTSGGGVDAIRPSKLAAERGQLLDDMAWDVTAAVRPEVTPPHLFTGAMRGVLNDSGVTAALDRFMASFTTDPAVLASQASVTPPVTPDPGQAAREKAIEESFPLRDVANALEREEALLAHLSANTSYYWLAMWQALSAGQQATLLQKSLPADIVDPWPIGMVGHRLAFPVSTDYPGAQEFIAGIFGDKLPPPRTEEVTLPTTAITMEARLGSCDGCEEFIRDSRAIDLRTRKAAARRDEAIAVQEEKEASRRQARLDHIPPMLDDPRPPQPPPRLEVHITDQPAPPVPGKLVPGG